MDVFVRTVWSNYEKMTLKEFNYRKENFCDTYYIVDELDNNYIYLLEKQEEKDD